MPHKRVLAEAPASPANLGSGFDVFAVVLKQPKDRLTLERALGSGSITVKGVGGLPEVPRKSETAIADPQGYTADHRLVNGGDYPMHITPFLEAPMVAAWSATSPWSGPGFSASPSPTC